jgi:beta-galactosidase
MTHPRLGVCYYPEHWPETYWRADARKMKDLGIDIVRIGEFAWTRLEPSEGAYDFGWLERAIEVLQEAGLKVALGTPTATPPRWLVEKMPDMLAVDRDGRPRKFGSRRHYCFSHAGYLESCARIVTALAEKFGRHPAIVAWQIDNEFGCHDTVESYSAAARAAFRKWCRRKHQTIEALNQAWGNVFWSMELSSFDDVDLPNLTVTDANPAHRMDFQRFSSDQVAAFNKRQVEIVRKYSPGRLVLHNFMGSFTAFDHYKVARDLDAAAWDSYPLGFLERSLNDEDFKLRYMRVGDPDYQAFHHDLYRGCGCGRFWVMEQQPGAVNWAPWNPAPAEGAVRLWSHEAFAAGAEVVSYFRWRQAPFAQEQMHEGLLLPNSAPAPAFAEVKRVAEEIRKLGLILQTPRADVALIFDYESAWAWDIEPQGQDFSYSELVFAFYRGLRRAGLSLDVVPPCADAVADRKFVLVPGLFCADDALVRALQRSDAVCLVGPRSGSKTVDFQIPGNLPPGAFGQLVDVTVERVESLRPGAFVAVENGAGALIRWSEALVLGNEASVELRGVDGRAVLARRGNRFYLAGWPDAALLDEVLRRCLDCASVDGALSHPDIRVRDNGPLRHIFNYGPEAVDIGSLLQGRDLLLGDVVLEPCGVAICRLPNGIT